VQSTAASKGQQISTGVAGLDLKPLCSAAWLPAVAAHLRTCLEGELRAAHAPAFFEMLATCHHAPDAGALEATLLRALRELAGRVQAHLAVIDAVAAACREHAGKGGGFVSLERVVGVREAYLGSVAAMLTPAGGVTLQRVCLS
jgi:hypothetical protein